MAFARNHIVRRAGLVLKSLFIQWLATVNSAATGPGYRAASRSTNSWADRGPGRICARG